MSARRLTYGLSLVQLIAFASAVPANAIPAFARQHGLPCAACHSHMPQLTDFGRAFLNNGFRIPRKEKEAPIALRRTFPFGVMAHAGLHYDSRPEEGEKRLGGALDAVMLLGGGLLTPNDSFYVHHHLLEDNRPGEVYELWAQHSFNGRQHLNLRAGQYEQPLGFSPEIARGSHSGYLVYEALVGFDDVAFSSPARGIMLSGGSLGDGFRYAVSVHAPQTVEGAHGEPEPEVNEDASIDRNLNSWFLRVQHQRGDRRIGIFGSLGSVKITTPDGTGRDHFTRIGIDAETTFRGARIFGTWLTGENSNPTVDGNRGSLNGGFAGIESPHIMLGGPSGIHSMAYLRYDRVHVRSADVSGVNEGPTLGLMMHPRQEWGIMLEYQRRRGDRNRFVLATHIAL